MADDASGYDTGAIRELLLAAFAADDLRRLCQDHPLLRPIVGRFGPKYNLEDMVAEAIDYCKTQDLFDELLSKVRKANPRQYARFESRLPISAEALAETPCPYRGLEVFYVEHAPNYFGREAMVRKLLDKLKDVNFVAVVGPSGCGKSSLVRAGMVPALRQGALQSSRAWRVETFLPGDDPLHALALTLVHRLMPDATAVDRLTEARKLADHLGDGTLPITDVLAQLRDQYPDLPRLILVADQFEEAFTLCTNETLRRIFLERLLQAAETPWITVVLTLRADFFGRVLEDERFGQCVDAGLVNVLPMSREERRLAVEQPALRARRRFEGGLVERILDAVEGSPGDLPLLEFALTELWGRQTAGGLLTHDAYEAIGEVRGAIARSADDTFARFDPDEQRAVRAIFTRLVRVARPDEGGEDTRRRVRLDELQPEAQALVKHLADARLLVTGQDPAGSDETVEVSHEALIRGWAPLQDWLNRDREFLLWRQRLGTLARIWEESGRGEGALLRDALLQEARVRSAERLDELSGLERAYLEKSEVATRRVEAAREAAQRRELEQAQALAREQRHRAEERTLAAQGMRRRNLFLAVALIVATLAAFWAGFFFLRERNAREQQLIAANLAEYQKRRARAGELAASVQSVLARNEDPSGSLALLLAQEAVSATWQVDGYITPSADAALREAVEKTSFRLKLPRWGQRDPVNSAAFSPDGATVVTAGDDGTARLWDATTGAELDQLQGHTEGVNSAAFSPDGQFIVTASDDQTARLWDVTTGVEFDQLRLQGHTASVRSAAFSPNGEFIVTASYDGTARLWDATTGAEHDQLQGHRGTKVNFAAFSHNGKFIVTAGADETARLWDAATGDQLGRTQIGIDDWVLSATFSPNDKFIVIAGDDGTALLWDPTPGVKHLRLWGHTGDVYSAAFSPNGELIVTAGDDGTARLWNAATGDQLILLQGHNAKVKSAAFSPDGELIVTAGDDGTTRLWDAATGANLAQLRLHGHTKGVNSVAFSPDGELIVTASHDGTARLWDAATGAEIRQLQGHIGEVWSAAFSPDGELIVTSGADGTARLWDAATGDRLGKLLLRWHTKGGNFAAFSPDGELIVTSAADETARLWDAVTGDRLDQLLDHTARVRSAAFSPDGELIVAAGADGTARLCDVASGVEIRQLQGHTASVSSAAFSPDGATAVTASEDGTARLWDVASGVEIRQLQGHTDSVLSAAFSPDGAMVVTASRDETARLWDVASGVVIRQLQGHTASVSSAAFSPDGATVVTASADGTACLWPSIEHLLSLAESLIQRDPPLFTPEERQLYGLDE